MLRVEGPTSERGGFMTQYGDGHEVNDERLMLAWP